VRTLHLRVSPDHGRESDSHAQRSGHLKPCDSYFLIADYQVSDYAADIVHVRESVWKVALGWLAVGLDPERSSCFIERLSGFACRAGIRR
jgi:hypothetical protein